MKTNITHPLQNKAIINKFIKELPKKDLIFLIMILFFIFILILIFATNFDVKSKLLIIFGMFALIASYFRRV